MQEESLLNTKTNYIGQGLDWGVRHPLLPQTVFMAESKPEGDIRHVEWPWYSTENLCPVGSFMWWTESGLDGSSSKSCIWCLWGPQSGGEYQVNCSLCLLSTKGAFLRLYFLLYYKLQLVYYLMNIFAECYVVR